MDNGNIPMALFGLFFAGMVLCWFAYQAGRVRGYHHGLEKGTQLVSKVQHLKGVKEGYAMAVRHTPGQRNEYMSNVLLKSGMVTAADIEAERGRHLHEA